MAIGKVHTMIPILWNLLEKIPASKPREIDYTRVAQLRQTAQAEVEEIRYRRSTEVKEKLDPEIQGIFNRFTQLENFEGCKTR